MIDYQFPVLLLRDHFAVVFGLRHELYACCGRCNKGVGMTVPPSFFVFVKEGAFYIARVEIGFAESAFHFD